MNCLQFHPFQFTFKVSVNGFSQFVPIQSRHRRWRLRGPPHPHHLHLHLSVAPPPSEMSMYRNMRDFSGQRHLTIKRDSVVIVTQQRISKKLTSLEGIFILYKLTISFSFFLKKAVSTHLFQGLSSFMGICKYANIKYAIPMLICFVSMKKIPY